MAKKNKTRNPARFSTHFQIDAAELKARGAFNPILNADTALFVDPLLLAKSQHQEMRVAVGTWEHHFRSIIRLLANSKTNSDVAWKAADQLFVAKEFKGTCLGYGAGSINGSGIGPKLKQRLMGTAHEIVQLGVEDPRLFPLLALLEDDIGPDRISDLTTRVIAVHLADFTTRVLTGFELPKSRFEVSGREFALPVNPYATQMGGISLPIILVPKDVMRDLPIASDWSQVDSVKSYNDALRKRINAAIGEIWATHSSKSKRENRRAFLKSRDAFESLLEATSEVPKRPYDFAGDPRGVANWLEMGQAFATADTLRLELKTQTMEAVLTVVEQIIQHFKHVVEDRGLWKNLYDSNNQPHHEPYAQRQFYGMSVYICQHHDVGIDPESDAGTGPVDFVLSRGFHARVAVELKLSTNQSIVRGYTKQLETYKQSQGTQEGHYVIVDVGGRGAQVEEVLELERLARNAGERHSRVTVIDATPKVSASKRA